MTLKKEIWYQDASDSDLWVNEQGLIVNTAALEERTPFYEVIRVPQQPVVCNSEPAANYAS